MSSETVVDLRQVGKCYQIFHDPADRLKQMFARGRRKYYSEYWAVRDVSLRVSRGERLAIVGKNGAGKSTLLQLMCGTLAPTHGEVDVRGRVAALLELGAGFNPEFTGRENVFLSATVLGFSESQIRERYPSIVDFADIGDFLDQPVKTYSTGMYARLAFAIAIHVEPEVLVIDEALSVGDEAFQRKCYARLQKMCGGGVTLLFVSHSANAVVELCDRAVLMDQGELLYSGQPKHVLAAYQRLAYAPKERAAQIRAEILASASPTSTSEPALPAASAAATGSEPETRAYFDPSLRPASTAEYEHLGASIHAPRVIDNDGREVNVLVPGDEYHYTYEVDFGRPARAVRFGMMLKTTTGVELAGIVSHPEGGGIDVAADARYMVTFRFPANLNPGNYFMNAGVTGSLDEGEDIYLHRLLDAVMIRIPPRKHLTTSGYVNLAVGISNPVRWESRPPAGTEQVRVETELARRHSHG